MRPEALPIIRALPRARDITVTVLGDYCLDKYLYIDPALDEISNETGLLAYQAPRKALYPGAAGTVTNNLRALGVRVICVGLVGDDGEGYELTRCLRQIGADTSLLIQTDRICTGTYTKPMRPIESGGPYREMNRLDFRHFFPTPLDLEDQLIANLHTALAQSQAVLISDQYLEHNCSVVTDRVRDAAAELAAAHPEKVFYADSRGFINLYREMTVKCNHAEAVKAIRPGFAGEITDEVILACGQSLHARNGKPVLISRGEKGLYIFDGETLHIPAFKVTGEIDFVGAGDATNAGYTLGRALGLTQREAGTLGCCVSSITIQQIGVTGTATVGQVEGRLRGEGAQ